MDSRRLAYLKALEIDVWERRDLNRTPEVPSGSVPEPSQNRAESQAVGESRGRGESPNTARPAASPTLPLPRSPGKGRVGASLPDTASSPVAGFGWDQLAAAVKTCTGCALHATRTQSVFGVGNRSARWMVVGEAPGADEDRQGEPFVGRAGQLLNSMLRAIGLAREQVFIANILKSRPPNNRDPRPEEVRACIPYLFRQIELVDPTLILCVGRIAAQTLLQTDTPIGKLRGTLHRIAGERPMIVTYHPAYLLRSPGEKRKAWSDLVLAMRTFDKLSVQTSGGGAAA